MQLKKLLGRQTALQASLLLVAITLLSKVLGFAREMIIAHRIGSSAEYDLFLVVFMLPALVMTTISYTVSKAVTPFYQQMRVEQGEKAANAYAWRITLVGSLFLGSLAFLASALAVPILKILLPTASPASIPVATAMFRVLSAVPLLFFCYAALGAFLQAERYFFVSSVGILLLNTFLVSTLLLARQGNAWMLVWGWILGLAAQALWTLGVYLVIQKRLGGVHGAEARLSSQYSTGLIWATLQIILIELWGQLWVVVDRYLAQHLAFPAGSISSISYATILCDIPLSVLNLGVGRAIFPFLAACVAAKNVVATRSILTKAIRWTLLFMVPAWLYMTVFSREIVTAFYQGGAFDANATRTTATAVQWLATSMLINGLYVILSTYLYAARNLRTLTIAVVLALAIKAGLSYWLGSVLGYQGLLIATVISYTTSFLLALWLGSFEVPWREFGRLALKVLGASLLAVGMALALTRFLEAQFPALSGASRLGRLALFGSDSVLVALFYLLGVLLLKIPEVTQAKQWAMNWLRGRFVRQKIASYSPVRLEKPFYLVFGITLSVLMVLSRRFQLQPVLAGFIALSLALLVIFTFYSRKYDFYVGAVFFIMPLIRDMPYHYLLSPILTASLLGLIVWRKARRHEWTLAKPPVPLAAALGFYLAAELLSTVLSTYPSSGFGQIGREVGFFLIIYLVYDWLRGKEQWESIAQSLLWLAVVTSLSIVIEWLLLGGPAGVRYTGLFASPTSVGLVLTGASPVAFSLLQGRVRDGKRGSRLQLVGFALLALLASVLTLTRNTWFTVWASLLLLLLWQAPKKVWLRLLAAIVVAALLVSLLAFRSGPFLEAYHYLRLDVGWLGRTFVLQRGWSIFLEHPLVGTGPNTYRYYVLLPDTLAHFGSVHRILDLAQTGELTQAERSMPGVFEGVLGNSTHNLFLDTMVTGGMLGLLALCGLLGAILWTGLKQLKQLAGSQDATSYAISQGCLVSILASLGAAQFIGSGALLRGAITVSLLFWLCVLLLTRDVAITRMGQSDYK